MGNGYLNQQMLGDSLVLFGYFHGLFGLKTWKDLVTNCCNSSITDYDHFAQHPRCRFVNNPASGCQSALSEATEVIRSNDVNIYNLYSDCDNPQLTSGRNATKSRQYFDKKLLFKQLGLEGDHLLHTTLRDSPPCIDDSYVARYLNQPQVRGRIYSFN